MGKVVESCAEFSVSQIAHHQKVGPEEQNEKQSPAAFDKVIQEHADGEESGSFAMEQNAGFGKEHKRMATLGLIEYDGASPEVRGIYDDIMATRKTDWVNNFWKALAPDPATLRRTWASIREIMKPGALDAVTKEMIYLAVSATNQCGYCIASHTAGARKAGMTDEMFAELMAVVGMANETNRLASGYRVEIDERFLP
jgi:AhpD family alkylhydroperoxidase